MAGNIKGITIEIDGNTTKLTKSLQDVNKSLKSTQTALKDVDKLLKLDPKNTTLLKQKQDLLKKAISDTKTKLDQEKKALSQLKANSTTGEVTAEQQALEREIIATEQKLKSLEAEYRTFGSVAKQKLQAVGDSLKKVSAKMSKVGESLTKNVTMPIIGVGTAAVSAYKDVRKGSDVIIKKTGASGKALKEMEESMENLATSIPTDFETAGAAIGEVNTRFGLTGEALEDLSGQFIKFADLNDTDVSNAVDHVQKVMALFGVKTEDAGLVLDTFNAVGQRTGISVDSLASSMITNGAAMKDMGFSASDAANFLGDIEVAGVDSNAVVKALKTSYKKAAKEGKNFSKTLSTLQQSIKDAKTDEEAAKIATEAFGAAAGPQMAAAIREGKVSLDELGTSLNDNIGSVTSTFDETVDPADEFKMALNRIKSALAGVGMAFLMFLEPAITKISEGIADVQTKWETLDPETQEMIARIAMIAAVAGPVILIISKIIGIIGSVIGAIGHVTGGIGAVVGALGGPLTAALAAVIGLIIWLVGETNNWDWATFVQSTKDGFNTMKENFIALWENLKSGFATIVSNFQLVWSKIKTACTTAFSSMKNSFKTGFSNMKQNYDRYFKPTIDNMKKGVTSVKNNLVNGFNKMKSNVSTVTSAIKTFCANMVAKLKSLFNFQWKLPAIKLPHIKYELISVPVLGSIPNPATLHVEWYRKAMQNGMVLNNPTVFGMNNGKLLGAGEAGAEVVAGYHSLQDMISGAATSGNLALAAKVDTIIAILSETMPDIAADKGVYIDSNKLVGALTPSLNRRLGASMGW